MAIMDNDKSSMLPGISRRAFITMAGAIGASAFLYSHAPQVVAAIENSSTKLVWLRGAGCGGCTSSLLNGGNPEVISSLRKIGLELEYHEGLMPQQGIFVDGFAENSSLYNSILKLKGIIEKEKYILVVEGAIPNGPEGSGKYFMAGGRPLKEIFSEAAQNAAGIMAAGTCAAFGGISSSKGGELMDARGIAFTGTSKFNGILGELGFNKQVVNVSGCPPNPDWILLTLVDMLTGADIEVDAYHRPVAFFTRSTVHDSCPRRGSYDRADRDSRFAQGKCLYDLGCKGPLTFADCSLKKWNGGVNMCTQSGGPCIACVEPGFPDSFSPFFKKAEEKDFISGVDVDTAARIILGASVLGAGIHAIKRLAIGDSDRDDIEIPEKKKESKRRL
jgi:hydrogenase small subunit